MIILPGEIIHQCESCDLCKAAAAHQVDHYALGRLRLTAGRELGLDPATTQQLDLRTLLGMWNPR